MLAIIDNGHGNNTPGKRYKGFFEWEFNRKIAGYLIDLINDSVYSIDHHQLVTEDIDIKLHERVKRANQIAKEYNGNSILISIHGNAFKDEGIHGIETFHYSESGKFLAQVFQDELIRYTGWHNRGIKQNNFYIIKYSSMPAVLTECGFYTNDKERSLMSMEYYQRKIALAHYEAIERISKRYNLY